MARNLSNKVSQSSLVSVI